MKHRFLIFVLVLSGGAFGRSETSPAPPSLSDFFKPGVAFLDTNDDGAVDFVNARIVLPDRPTAAELAAAADVAARFGFETSAMDLPVEKVRLNADSTNEKPSVFIGAAAIANSGTTVSTLGASSLKPGEGFVAAFSASGKPSLVVLGGDDDGLNAAAVMVAGHLPLVWDQKGPTADQLAADVRQYLDAHNATTAAATAAAMFVEHGVESAARVLIDAQMATAGDVVKAQVALNQLKAVGGRDPKRALSYPDVRSLRVRVRAAGAYATVELPRAAAPDPATQPPARRPGSGAKENFDLSTFYANEGALGDSDNNLIPDRVDVVLSADGDGVEGVIDLAARLGLESTGVQVPIAKTAKATAVGESEPILVLIGTSHPAIDQLIKNKKWARPELQPGEGLIELVKKAVGEKSALIVTGGDAAGVRRAIAQLAERFPHIWARGKDRTTLDDIEDDVRKFVAGRSPAGQAAMSLYKLDKLSAELQGKDLASARVRVFAEKAPDRLADIVKQEAAAKIKAGSIAVVVQNLDVQKGRSLVSEEFDIPSEVDEFWAKLRSQVVPALRKDKKHPTVAMQARLSEPPEVRKQIEQQARAELVKAGADEKSSVTVLSAYKQGYSWLYDVVRPALAGKAVDQITIRFAEIGPASGWKQQGMYVPTRWLLEIYPIDEIVAQELKIDLKKITFEKRPIASPAYEVVATAPGGAQILRQTFEPKVVERPFFDRFPDYERVRVTTGWISADINGQTVVDERIETDPERFWDHFQAKTLPALYDHVMTLGKGKPRAEDAPFFGELTVDLSMSEPEYRLPIDQEQIASMEALHEEIYFNTLHFFDVMGRFTRGANLNYPGRVIPIMHPRADGKPGHAKISLTGFDAPRPMVVVDYVERNGNKGEVHLDLPKIAVDRPQTIAAHVRDGKDGIDRLDLRLKVDTEKDERNDFVKRRAEEQVDRQIVSAEQVQAVFKNLAGLRSAGLYRDALAYHDLGGLRVTASWEHENNPDTEVVAMLEGNGDPAPWPDIRKYIADRAIGDRRSDGPLVQWDTPIPPSEAYEILAKMSTFPEATVYEVGHSYLGKDIWAMDVMPPIKASHWSQAKQTTLKPTIVYSARQHANEVSSTSHTLKLAEMLLTDPANREKLKKVNVVFHPITNPDGAQLAYDLQKINPNYMLHAGYLGALGVDVVNGQFEQDPIYPETGIRPKIWRAWLPDIFLNPHGYPSHEWVQLFSEYAAWVRTRAVETREYWTMRGWWMPGFAWLDDPRYPRHKGEQMKLLNMITEFAKAAPSTVALNQRAYERYRRYSFDFDQKNFKLDFTNGVLIYKSIKGARASPQAQDFMARQPNVTVWDGSTEAPDETARGDWMKLVATAGLQWDKAILEYLVQGRHEIERKVELFWNGVSLSINRPRPPKPAKEEEKKTTSEIGR